MISAVQRITGCGMVLFASALLVNAADKHTSPVSEKTIQKFKDLDRDSNGQLSADEYVARREPTLLHGLHRRDFQIFDLDHDNSLSLVEFAPIANGIQGNVRGPIPDPLVKLVDQFVTDLDGRLKNWNERANDEIGLEAFFAVLPKEFHFVLTPSFLQQADTNRNGTISRSEARRFLEIQLGLRLPNGQPLRMPNGRVNNYSYFLHLDRNQNQRLEFAEFVAQTGGDQTLQKRFAESDNDGDGILTLDEWFISPWTYYDPVEDFRNLDANMDGFLDEQELIQKITDWRKTGVKFLVQAFDDDRDGKMSIDEYRLAPLANIIITWQQTQTDSDNDQKLSLSEFTFYQPYFPMLRVVYFRHFDLNKDGYLDLMEYEFKTVKPFEMFALNSDGTGLKKLDVGNNVRFGSPAVSPDGRWIAFDGAAEFNLGYDLWQIQIIPITGGTPKSICNGVQPTWSKDGLKLVCSRFQPMRGIWIMDIAGGSPHYVGPGWGSQWSPDGKSIYILFGNSMRIYDLATNETKEILAGDESDYVAFDMNATWSPDSKRLCVNARRARNAETSDVVIVDPTAKGNERIKLRLSGKQIGGDFAWHPDGHRIVFSMLCEERKRRQLYQFDPDTPEGLVALVSGQPENRTAIDITWTPDGKQLIFNATDDN